MAGGFSSGFSSGFNVGSDTVNTVYMGDTKIASMKLGDIDVLKAYMGSILVYELGVIDTDHDGLPDEEVFASQNISIDVDEDSINIDIDGDGDADIIIPRRDT